MYLVLFFTGAWLLISDLSGHYLVCMTCSAHRVFFHSWRPFLALQRLEVKPTVPILLWKHYFWDDWDFVAWMSLWDFATSGRQKWSDILFMDVEASESCMVSDAANVGGTRHSGLSLHLDLPPGFGNPF